MRNDVLMSAIDSARDMADMNESQFITPNEWGRYLDIVVAAHARLIAVDIALMAKAKEQSDPTALLAVRASIMAGK